MPLVQISVPQGVLTRSRSKNDLQVTDVVAMSKGSQSFARTFTCWSTRWRRWLGHRRQGLDARGI